MKQRWPLLLLLASPVLLLVSLYLPWQEATLPAPAGVSYFSDGSAGTHAGLQNLFTSGSPFASRPIDGWSDEGEVAALGALLLLLLAVGALARPAIRERLPLGQVALLVGYFTVATAVEARLVGRQEAAVLSAQSDQPLHFHFAYGAGLGIAAGVMAAVGSGLLRRERLGRPPLRKLPGIAAAVALLAALLLPWARAGFAPSAHLDYLGIADASGVVVAVLALRLVVALWTDRDRRSLEQVALAGGALLFTGAAFTIGFGGVHAYGAWAGLIIAIVLALAVLGELPHPWLRVTRLPARVLLPALAGLAFVTSLFLPWQAACYGDGPTFRALGLADRCVSGNGFGLIGSVAGAVAILLVAVSIAPRGSSAWLTVVLAVLVVTLGFSLDAGEESGVRLGLGYGSFIGFVAGAVFVILELRGLLRQRVDIRRLLVRLPALGLSLACLAVVVVPWWGVLPVRIWSVFAIGLTAVSWLTLASAIVGLGLLREWIRTAQGRSSEAPLLAFLPLALAALAALTTIPRTTGHLTWNVCVLLGLSLPLALLGLAEARGGIRQLGVPEILRIDRI